MAVKKHLAVAGNLPSLSSFLITPSDIPRIREALHRYDVNVSDFVLLSFLGFVTVPLFEVTYSYWERWSRTHHTNRKDHPDEHCPVRETYAYVAAVHFAQAARIAIVVCLADLVGIVLSAKGVPLRVGGNEVDLGLVTARVAYTVWLANRAVVLKRYVLSRIVEKRPEKVGQGKAIIIDRLLNAVIAMLTFMFVVDMLDADIGAGLGSLFAMGGMGTLVFSLASKDLAGHLVSGLALSASDKFYEGDVVQLGDGTQGTVVRLSWMHTIIRGGDELNIKIPNSSIANMRVCNLSRAKNCRVKQTLYFNHSDMSKMSNVCTAIKDEIREACPDLINDGSRPFRAHWTDITTDRLEVVVDCRFDLKPIGDAYLDNRMKVLQAIERAMAKVGVKNAVPVVMHATPTLTST